MTDGNVLEFLKEFIDSHPRLDPEEEIKLANLFRHAYDVKQQLLLERDKILKEGSSNVSAERSDELDKELAAIEDMLANNKEIKN
jgi:hypothetical protein